MIFLDLIIGFFIEILLAVFINGGGGVGEIYLFLIFLTNESLCDVSFWLC